MTISDLLNKIRFDGSLLGADWYNVVGVQVTLDQQFMVDVLVRKPRERDELRRFQFVDGKWQKAR